AKETFEYIIVDLPPLGPVVDAKAFAPLADGFVLVTEWGRTPRAMVQSILSSEPYIANKIVGVVLNKVDLKKLAKYGSIGGSEKFFDRYSTYYLEKSEARTKANT
ncbi:MAG: chain-length determining protein, partial [Mesorhizobium sp.]